MNLMANSRSVKTLVADQTEAIPAAPPRSWFMRYLPAIVWADLIIHSPHQTR